MLLVSGNGLAAELLVTHGVSVFNENEFHQNEPQFDKKL